MSSEQSSDAVLDEAAEQLVKLLQAGIFSEFLELYRKTAKGVDEGAIILAAKVNDIMKRERPEIEAPILVSNEVENKHLVVIQDGSRFFGDAWTVTRSAFIVE